MCGRKSWRTRVTASVALMVVVPSLAVAQSFQGLGSLPGASVLYSVAKGISADGSTVVGWSNSSIGAQAFRWTSGTGMIGLGYLPGCVRSNAWAASSNASVIVGDSEADPGTPRQAFLWTPGGGMVGLGWLWGDPQKSWATGVSRNGSVVVGSSYNGLGPGWPQAFRWTSTTGMIGLGELAGGSTASYAAGVSPDGSQVVGQSYVGFGGQDYEAFLWTEAGGMVGIGDLPGGEFRSAAWCVNAAGTVFGFGYSASGREAFRYTSAGGMVGLGDLPGGDFSSAAYATSDDGSIVVGEGTSASGTEAVVWIAGGGPSSLRALLVNTYGLNLNGWTLDTASGVSANGRTIVGTGTHNGRPEAWVATLPAPEMRPRTWRRVATTGPSARAHTAMGYDFERQQVVLFGGTAGGTLLGDTWIWGGTRWTKAAPPSSPSARWGHMMTGAEPGFSDVVLYGGGPAAMDDTWEWQGGNPLPSLGTWVQIETSPRPWARYSGAMAYHPSLGSAILFGGGGHALAGADTWEYFGQWQQLSVTGPSARSDHAMALDRARNKIVLFGGMLHGGAAVGNGETWVWDGSRWIQRFPEPSPPARYGHAMAYDPLLQRVVLFGGLPSWPGSYLQDTWEWDGINWVQVTPVQNPAGRVFTSMCEDRWGQVILFGGESYGASNALPVESTMGLESDTWAYGEVVEDQVPAVNPWGLIVMSLSLIGAGALAYGWANRRDAAAG